MALSPTPRAGLTTYTAGTDPHPTRVGFNAERALLDAIMALAYQGTTAARPAAGKFGRFYWDTTASRLFWDDGATWQEVSTNGGGGPGAAIVPGVAATEGTAARSARADHTHLLALATASLHGAMSSTDKAKLDAAVSAATASTVMMRDAAGRTQAATPAASQDVANKTYVDTAVATRAASAHTHDASDISGGVLDPARLPAATGAAQGALSAADKNLLDAATSGATPSTLVKLDASGRAQVAAPAAAADIARKDYVDTQVATRAASTHTHNAADVTAGVFAAARLPLATTAASGALSAADKAKLDAASATATPSTLVMNDAAGRFAVAAPAVAGDAANKGYVDTALTGKANTAHTHAASDVTTGVFSPARLPAATTAAAGSMSAADKAMLDNASAAATPSTLVMNDAAGRFAVAAPAAAADAANKGYVDTQVATRAASTHTHAWGDITGEPATFPPTIGSTSTTAKAGNWLPSWNEVSSKPTTFAPSAHSHAASDLVSGDLTMARLRLAATNDASETSTLHAFQIGPDTGENLVMDGNELGARNNGSFVELYIAGGATSGTDPVGASSLTRKDYVDTQVATRAASSHTHAAATTSVDGFLAAADKVLLSGATSSATGSTLAKRHSSGSIQVVTGTNSSDAANKGYVDGKTWDGADITTGTISDARIANASSTKDGLMSKADKALLDGRETSGWANTLVVRDSGGRFGSQTPVATLDVATKGYVDSGLGAKLNSTAFSDRIGSGSTYTQIHSAGKLGVMNLYDSGVIQAGGVYNNDVGDSSSRRAVWVDSGGYMGFNLSSEKYKTSIVPYEVPLDVLAAVEPKRWQYKSGVQKVGAENAPWYVNFLAEDLHDAGLTEYVSYDGEGTARENVETINEQLMVNALWSFARQQQDALADMAKRMEQAGL